MNKQALYYQWPPIKEFDADVVSCKKSENGYSVQLDQDGFYPEGGGQPCDTGTIENVHVYNVQETPQGIVHYTDGPVSGRVHCCIDWQQRMRHTQNHSGEHIVSGLVHSRYGYDNVGFHMETRATHASGIMTIDFNGVLSWNDLMDIEWRANQVIRENHPVHTLWPGLRQREHLDYRSKKKLDGDVRIIAVDGIDVCACCGTHVASTGEIGLIKILSVERHRKGVRIEMVCGMDALAIVQAEHQSIQALKRKLASSSDRVVDAVQKLLDTNQDQKRVIAQLHQHIYEEKAKELYAQSTIVLFERDRSANEIRNLADYLVHHTKAHLVAVFTEKTLDAYAYAIASKDMDLRKQVKHWNQILQGRGGGQAEMVQGIFASTRIRIETVFHAIS